jgi:PAS domain S-box-containing protein
MAPERARAFLHPPRLSWPLRYATAPAIALLLLGVQRAVFPSPSIAPFVLFTAGVALTSWLAGRGPGLVATALSAALGNYFFIGRSDEWDFTRPALLATGLFAVAGAAISLLSGWLRAALDDAEKKAGHLETALAEQAKAQQSLRASEERLLLARTAARLGIYDHDMRTDRIEWDDRMRELWGLAPETPVTWQRVLAGVHPDDRPLFLSTVSKARSDGHLLLEYRVVDLRDGRVRWVRVTGHVAFADGQPVRQVGTVEDVTERKRAEEDRARLAAIVESSDDAILSEDTRGVVTSWNRGSQRIFGYTAEEVVGRPIALLIPPDRQGEEASILKRLRAGERIEHYETVRLTKDQRRIDVSVRASPLSDRDGRVTGASKIVRDIGERKRAERVLAHYAARLQGTLESIGDAFFSLDEDVTVTYFNKAAERVLGKRREEVVGRRLFDSFPEARGTIFEERYLRALREKKADSFETFFDRPPYVNWFEVRISPWEEGIAVFFQVITERKAAESERERLLEALREADRRKDDFLGMLSHELRNPLAPIRNSLYILERAAPGGEQARRAHTVIDRQVGHLARLVDDLLDVTRISRGKIRLQRTRIDLVEVVRRAVEDLSAPLQGHEVAIELPDESVWVDGDPTRLAQVIGNLLTNAAKFTPREGAISVSLRRREGRAELEIADTGIGIDAEMLQKLFEPFAQADRSLDRSRGGLGLGLALVKGLVEQHGGEVSAHSDGPGRGARFTLAFPLDQRGAAAPGPSQVQAAAGPRRSVLIVEDNKDAADSLFEALSLSDHRVTVAYDGEAGVAKARELRPEVVLCDIGLPAGMDGYAVARSLRRDSRTTSAYLVALTGYAQPEDRHRALDAGFDTHLAKPLDLAELERLLAQAPVHHTQAGGEAVPS